MPKKHDPKRERERKDGLPKKHDPANKVRHEKEHAFICALTYSIHKHEYKPMDPIFDLATDLSQADDILPHPSKLHIYHQSR